MRKYRCRSILLIKVHCSTYEYLSGISVYLDITVSEISIRQGEVQVLVLVPGYIHGRLSYHHSHTEVLLHIVRVSSSNKRGHSSRLSMYMCVSVCVCMLNFKLIKFVQYY